MKKTGNRAKAQWSDLCNAAEQLCHEIANDDLNRSVGANLRTRVSFILALGEDLGPPAKARLGRRLIALSRAISKAAVPLFDLGEDGYSLYEVKAKLEKVADLVTAIEEIGRSGILSLDESEEVLKATESLVNPALRLAVRLVDPDRHEFEWVDDLSVRVGAAAMSIAWRTSALVEDQNREIWLARKSA